MHFKHKKLFPLSVIFFFIISVIIGTKAIHINTIKKDVKMPSVFSKFSAIYYSLSSYHITGKKVPALVTLSREDILNATADDYTEDTVVQWDGFKKYTEDKNDGRIPVNLLNDPVYCSMNLPSESVCDYMTSVGRDNAHFIGDMNNKESVYALAIGALYPSTGVTLPDEFTICLGKIKLFAYSKSAKDWIILDEHPYPDGIYIYTLPWTTSTSQKCKNTEICDDHIEVTLTGKELTGNVLHFWGKPTTADKKDYPYYACAYEFWIKGQENNNLLTATLGIDAKDSTGFKTIIQLLSSRGLTVTNTPKIHWGHTVPNSKYSTTRDGQRLEQLYLQ